MTTPTMTWDEVLALFSTPVTFSVNCRSGLLPAGKCQCWRCRDARGQEVTAATERQAAREAAQADKTHAAAVSAAGT